MLAERKDWRWIGFSTNDANQGSANSSGAETKMMILTSPKRKSRHGSRDSTSRVAVIAAFSLVVFTCLIGLQISPKVVFLKNAPPGRHDSVLQRHYKEVSNRPRLDSYPLDLLLICGCEDQYAIANIPSQFVQLQRLFANDCLVLRNVHGFWGVLHLISLL